LEIARFKRLLTALKAERDILKKRRGLLREGIDVKFCLIAKHRGIWPADWLYGALGVSHGGFYAWLKRPRSRRNRTMKSWARRLAPAFLGATGPSEHPFLTADGSRAQFVTDALMMAMWRKPDALLHYSDRGSQCTSEQFQRLMAERHRLKQGSHND
jgi:transposase InsO family protein